MRNKKICVTLAVITAVAAAISGAAFFMKRHRCKSGMIAFTLVAAIAFGVLGLSTTAYAKDAQENGANGEEYTQEYTPDNAGTGLVVGEENIIPALPTDPTSDEDEETADPVPTNPPQALTPPGNMNLVDDFSGELAQDKQFITVVTRNGHFFYIVIDRAAERQNVHFLTLVSEYDLFEILEDEARLRPSPIPVEPMPEVVPPTETDPDTTEPITEDNGGGIGGLLVMLLLVGAVGGGAYYYFKVRKPGQGATGTTPAQIDEFVFDEDEEDYSGGGMDYSGASDRADFSGADDEDDMPDFTATESEDE